jgi:glucosamine-6-phosphate deaminase
VPEARKAEPVRRALAGPIDTACPASILRTRSNATLYLDAESASRYFFDGTDGRLPVR